MTLDRPGTQQLPEEFSLVSVLFLATDRLRDYRYRLLEVRTGINGYPCEVHFAESKTPCNDKSELETVLRRIVKDPRTKAVIGTMMALTEGKPESSKEALPF